MARRPMLPPELLGAPFRGSEAVHRRLLTKGQLRSGCWRRVLRDVYCHIEVPDSSANRAAALALVVPPGAAVAGTYAAWLHGADIVRHTDELTIVAPRGSGLRPAGVVVRETTWTDPDVVLVDGVPVTSPLRTAFDLGRQKDMTEGVVALDAMAHRGLIDLAALAAYAEEHGNWVGLPRLRRVLGWCEPRAESPMESRLRMVLVLGGLPRPEVQIEVRESGLLVARVDMGYRRLRIGIEFDGRDYHRGQARVGDDIRDNSLGVRGWHVLRYGAGHVYRHQNVIAHEVGTLLAAGRAVC